MKGSLARLSIAAGAVTFAAIVFSALHPQAARSAQGAQMQAGRKVFEAHCAVCHGSHGQGGIGPNLAQIASRRSFDDTVAFVENPVGPMPKLYPAKLSEKQVRDVVSYIRQAFRSEGSAGSAGTQPYSGRAYGSMGAGMMYGYGPGGYGPGMMSGYGGMESGMMSGSGMMGGSGMGYQYGARGNRAPLNLSVDQVRHYFQRWLTAEGNPHVKLGKVEVRDSDTIVAEIVTVNTGSLVVRYLVNRHTGYITPE